MVTGMDAKALWKLSEALTLLGQVDLPKTLKELSTQAAKIEASLKVAKILGEAEQVLAKAVADSEEMDKKHAERMKVLETRIANIGPREEAIKKGEENLKATKTASDAALAAHAISMNQQAQEAQAAKEALNERQQQLLIASTALQAKAEALEAREAKLRSMLA